MGQVDFSYALAADAAGLPLAVSILADDPRVRAMLQEDVVAAGFAVRDCGALGDLAQAEADSSARPLGELVLVDCPAAHGAALAALVRLDGRVAHAGARMIVSTALATLEDVFGACAQSSPQILVDPLRAERVIAVGRTLAELPGLRMRELSETDRLALLRLTEQVGHLAHRLDGFDREGWGLPGQALGNGSSGAGSAFRFASPVDDYRGPEAKGKDVLRKARPALPDASLLRKIIARRKTRTRFFEAQLFADPAWDMLLDLAAAREEHARVSVTSLCIASAVPPTTALRWIGQMVEAGLFERVEDEADRRRAFIRLSDKAADAMARYFVEIGKDARLLV